jgi:hypothetical protein
LFPTLLWGRAQLSALYQNLEFFAILFLDTNQNTYQLFTSASTKYDSEYLQALPNTIQNTYQLYQNQDINQGDHNLVKILSPCYDSK